MSRVERAILIATFMIVLITLLYLLWYSWPPITLFEDGSIQYFSDTMRSYCIFPEWGCTP